MKRTTSSHYSAAMAAKLAGLSRAMVNYLCRAELVVPSGQARRGRGVRRRYTFGDIVALRLVADMCDAGISPVRLKKALLRMRRVHPTIKLTSLSARRIANDGRDILLRNKTDSLERLIDGQFTFAFVVELADIQREIRQKIERAIGARKTARKTG